MINLLTIIGARPQIIKASALSRVISTWNTKHDKQGQIADHILHTGQHYDPLLSDIFFKELSLPMPSINLNIGSDSHGRQTARMIEGIEKTLLTNQYDGVVVYGDTNSTLAAVIATSKLSIPLFHVEAGLRSWNRTMPEEINRVASDHLANILFAPTKNAIKNLKREGISTYPLSHLNKKSQYAVLTGDVMYDNALYYEKLAEASSHILTDLSLIPKHFALLTIHRPSNTDDKITLETIFKAIITIAKKNELTDFQIVMPVHPRTLKAMNTNLPAIFFNQLHNNKQIHFIEPVSYLDMLMLEKYAEVVLTDSGGVQKESYFFNTPSVILRNETEWTEIVANKAGFLCQASEESIVEAYRKARNSQVAFKPIFGKGNASEKIVNHIVRYFDQKSKLAK